MKIVSNKGQLIEQLPDGAAVIYFHDDNINSLIPRPPTPDGMMSNAALLASALMIFLRDKKNVAMLMDSLPARDKNHRHN